MKPSWRQLAGLVFGLIILAALALYVVHFNHHPPLREEAEPQPTSSAIAISPSGAVNTASASKIPGSEIGDAAAGLRNAADRDTARRQLDKLRQLLSIMSASQASAAIRQFLDSKTDAPTRQGFKIGGKGLLDSAPTLRVFLLDYLGRIDPEAAAMYSRTILSSMDSADEWAVALRNLVTGDGSVDARGLAEQKLDQMLHHEPWQQDPSVGFLESFDAAVYLGGTNFVPTLSELVSKKDNPAVAHAAYLALDRLIINNPTELLTSLESDLSLLGGRELTRANFFARADVRDPQQRQVLETYLLDPRLGLAELNQFAGLFPSGNYMISQNLLTPSTAPTPGSLINRDVESLRVIDNWLTDPRFVQLAPQLQKLQARLQGFLAQTGSR